MTGPEPLSEAVQAQVASKFPAVAREEVLEALGSYGLEAHEPEVDRVRLAILELAGGESASVLHLVRVANEDFRDVLSWQAQERGEAHKPTPEKPLPW